MSNGRVKSVKLLRTITALEVKSCILHAFKDLQITFRHD